MTRQRADYASRRTRCKAIDNQALSYAKTVNLLSVSERFLSRGDLEGYFFSVAAAAGGALRALKTTPLLTTEEGLEVMKKAGGVGYRPPR